MTDGFKTVLSASEKDCRDLLVSARGRTGSSSRISRKIFGCAGSSMLCLTGFNQVDLDYCSKVVHRSQRALD